MRMTTSADARYAIYFLPAAQMNLYQFGRSILGYDCYTGKDVGLLDDLEQEFANWREITDEPRRYGFHATLKAPFRLPPSRSEAALTDAFDKFAKLGHPVAHIEPEIITLGDFIAIVPRRPTPAHDTFRCIQSADDRKGTGPPGGIAPKPKPDAKPRPLGLSLCLRGFPISYDV